MLKENKLHKDKHAVILVVNNEERLLQEELVQKGEPTQRANIQKRKRDS